MLRRGAFTRTERAITWVVGVALFGAGALGVALGMYAHLWLLAVAGLGVWCVGAIYSYAARLGHPL